MDSEHRGAIFEADSNNKSSERKRNSDAAAANGSSMDFDEQLHLLRDLVFKISVSNLIKSSEPKAILGSELEFATDETSQQNGSNQVSRSASLSELKQPPSPNIVSSLKKSSLASGAKAVSANYEISITIAAICGTVVLSMLTITLLVVVLKNRKQLAASQPITTTSSVAPREPTQWAYQTTSFMHEENNGNLLASNGNGNGYCTGSSCSGSVHYLAPASICTLGLPNELGSEQQQQFIGLNELILEEDDLCENSFSPSEFDIINNDTDSNNNNGLARSAVLAGGGGQQQLCLFRLLS